MNVSFKIPLAISLLVISGLFMPMHAASHFIHPAADSIIRGRVIVDSTGGPLKSATVTDQSSGRATTTNENGEFSLTVKRPGATLRISHVGFVSREVKIAANTNMPVIIALKQSVGELGEVVVVSTGYERLPRERATGSFDVISKTLFNKQVSTDVLGRLEAVANGYQVDRVTSGAGIAIRGLSTIMGPTAPLIIVDNFPYDGDINNINPNDVDNITILKDAAAASVWGSRAGNGVIVITTKKGSFNQKATVDFNASVTVLTKPDLGWIPQISSSDLINTEIFLYGQGDYNSKFDDFMRPPLSPVVEILRKRTLGEISATDSASQIDALRGNDVRRDFDNYFYQRGLNQQYSIGVRGGNEKLAWIMSAGADRNVNNLAAGYNRYNFKWDNTWSATDRLRVTTGVYYTESKNISGRPGYGNINLINGALPVYASLASASGEPFPVAKDYRQVYTDTAGNGALLDWNYYPLTDYQHTRTTSGIQDFLGKAGLSYRFSNSFSADILYQYERQRTSGRTLYDPESYYTRDMINSFSQINDGTVTYAVPLGGILDLSQTDLVSQQGRGQFNFNHTWGDYSLAAIAGGEIRQVRSFDEMNRTYGYNDNILTSVNVDLVHSYPNYITGWENFIYSGASLSALTNRYVSAYANALLTYKEKYSLSASARRDASNLFGVSTNNRWAPLWSSGLSWNISKESFYHSSFIPYLRLRATYGVSGNVNPRQSALTVLSYAWTSQYTGAPTAYVSDYSNPELRWEKSYMFNIGADFSLRNKRVTGSIEYFRKRGVDLYGPSLVDYTAGLGTSTVLKNVASMRGHGLDVQLSSVNMQKAITWTTTFNASFYKDKITRYYLASQQGSNYVTGTLSTVSGVEGKPVYALLSYKWAGLDPATGDPMGLAGGKPSTDYNYLIGPETTIDSLKYSGPAMPTMYGSVINTISWQGLSLTFAITYKAGHYFRRESINYSTFLGGGNGNADFAERWQHPGDEAHTNVPSMVYPASNSRSDFYSGSAVLVEKSDFIRLQFVTLSYNVKKIIASRAFENMEVYLNCNNPGLLWKNTKYNIDPDYPSFNARVPVSYAAGVRVTL